MPLVLAMVVAQLLFAQAPGLSPPIHAAVGALLTGVVGGLGVILVARAASRRLDEDERDPARRAAALEFERAEAAVRTERGFSRAMIDSMPGVVYLYDSKGRFLRWNRNF
jgi:PAS domain-containing protein